MKIQSNTGFFFARDSLSPSSRQLFTAGGAQQAQLGVGPAGPVRRAQVLTQVQPLRRPPPALDLLWRERLAPELRGPLLGGRPDEPPAAFRARAPFDAQRPAPEP